MSKGSGLRKWQPGESGNPSGYSREERGAVQEALGLCRKLSARAIEKIWHIACHSKFERVQLIALEMITTHGLPKPTVRHEGEVEHRHFVLRAPPVMTDSAAWEEKYGSEIELQAIPAALPVPEPDPPIELPAIPPIEPRPPVIPRKQGRSTRRGLAT